MRTACALAWLIVLAAFDVSTGVAQDNSRPPVIGETRSAPTAEEVARRDQGALLRAGARTIEFGVLYSRSERESFPVARAETTALAATIIGRYGLSGDLQITGRLPLVYTQNRSTVAGTSQVFSSTSDDRYAADVSLSLLGIGAHETLGRPNILWSIDAQVPTGPGDRGLGGSAIFSKSFDPVVLFAGVAYMRGLGIDATNPRRQLPRDSLRLSLGYTYAVNDILALNTVAAWSNLSVPPPPQSGTLPASEIRQQLQVGLTWMLKRGLFLEPAVSFRIGSASPDATFSLNVPYTF